MTDDAEKEDEGAEKMAKYIDADALIIHLSDYALTESPNDTDSMKDRLIHETAYNAINECIKTVEEMPAADVEPVRHGRWTVQECYSDTYIICPACGFSIKVGTPHRFKWCPGCGAKMDGGSEE